MIITRNAVFNSDPLIVLERLQADQIALAYVDAPFYSEAEKSSENVDQAQIADHWNYLAQVLQQIRRTLTASGTLFFNTNPFSPVNARFLLDKIFGKENFRAEIVCWYRMRNIGRTQLATDHDTILFYSRSNEYTYHEVMRPLSENEIRERYHHGDKKTSRGPYRLVDLTRSADKSTSGVFDFEWRGHVPGPGRSWRYSNERLEQLASEGSIHFSAARKTLPKLKVYAADTIVPVGFVWDDVSRAAIEAGSKTSYSSKKPLSLLERIIEMGSNAGGLVFDPFATSGQMLAIANRTHRIGLSCVKSDVRYRELIESLRNSEGLYAEQDFQTGDRQYLEHSHPLVLQTPGLRQAVESDLGSFANAIIRPDPIRNRWALLIGVNVYVDRNIPNLSYCVNDVLALKTMLESLGYNVVCLHDDQDEPYLPTRANIEEELANICRQMGQEDFLFVHFSGHGKRLEQVPVLVPREARIGTLARSGLTVSALEEQMRSGPARRLLLTLDACQSGVEMGREVPDAQFITNVNELAEEFALIAASTARQAAREEPEFAHGIFTHFLVEGLNGNADRDGKGFVTVDDLRGFTLDHLMRWNLEHGVLQEPTSKTEGIGDMIVADHRQRLRH